MARHPKARPKKPQDPAKIAAKKARREERKAREVAERKRLARRKRFRQGVVVAVFAGLAVVIGLFLFRQFFPEEIEGVESVASRGREHVATGQVVNYDDAAPTSGSHYAQSPRCGVYSEQLQAELAVHALEHGAVVIWYRTDLTEELAPRLRDIVREFDDRVVLSPNAEIDDPIVVTAWNRRKAYNGVDDEIREFIEVYRGRGPERVPCPI